MYDLDFIVSGTPRSGTRYMARLFTSAGLPCTHELLFGMPGNHWAPDKLMKGESSWLAAPYLSRLDVEVIHVIRHPFKTISSMMKDGNLFGMFGNTVYGMWKFITMPEIRLYQGLDRYIAFYLKWNKLVEKEADHTFRLGLDDPESLFEEMGVDIFEKSLYTKKVNRHHSSDGYIESIDEIDSQFKDKLIKFLDKYGFNKTSKSK